MAGTNRFSTPIAVTLLAAVLLGLIAVFVFPPLPLVVVALLLATAFGAGAYGLSRRVAYLKQNQYFGQGNRQGGGRPLVAQLFTATVGLTVVSVLMGFGAAFQAVSAGAAVVAAPSASPAASSPELPPSPTPEPSPTEEPSPTPETEPSPTDEATNPTPDPSGTVPPGLTVFLDERRALAGYTQTGAYSMSATLYQRSVRVSCERPNEDYTEWNVAGFHTLKATLGISDDQSNAFGAIGEFIFYNQNGNAIGKPHVVSVGSPKKVEVDLTGVVRLRITCSGRDSKTSKTRSLYTIYGDATIVS
ncbi:hypothetical protein [Catellatospora bangladeshensis]|uniref:Glycosyl hydrolase family 98 putative carbohydrate-binding module domain-containing protein n=1 Tax=Catellatospora bangladeshensis TaxID=310355 RepID=A0A8J3JVD8_9ACTN|nr:hypothetical protein [Catellatospora bangladeshensis]GIF85830.1 hypothetical protein Cba03nite_71790 [Catellatospora bangladeshensis]